MPDDTTAALQALIKQVVILTTTVSDQQKKMDDLHEHNGRLLDKVMDAKRELPASEPKPNTLEQHLDAERDRRDLDVVGMARGPDGKVYLQSGSGPAPHVLTREQARDPVQYRAAKEAAAAAGVELRVASEHIDPTTRNTGRNPVMSSKTITFDDTHERIRYVRADMNTGSGLVARRMQAERDGYKVRSFSSLDDLPDHARTKFNLMEKAAQDAASGE
ncbi:hypothetical protein E4Z66_03365 [Aliishimia ponticola]|uniref:Uncharacterized protein n=1 Tax=Aliishimia ponticola TaxID=2499833 RepID=A0A4S4NK20_9RHOB|nr:hypothetical protein [Aliishimia ponticola]THH38621.1 hypothetical protein E4Z66_03365 [Aliishimia ponticola]